MRLAKTAIIVIMSTLMFPLEAKDGLSGKVYYEWLYPIGLEAGEMNEFSLHRVYFAYEKHIWEDIKVKLLADVARPGSAWNVYQKYAYLQYETTLGNMLIGLQGMNVFNITESNWGYRFLAKSSMDDHHFASSADMGLGFARTFAEKVHLHLTITNGGGYKHVEDDNHKKLAIQAVFGEKDLPHHPGFNAGIVFSNEPYDLTIDTTESVESRSVFTAFGAFATKSLRIGGEFDSEIESGGHTRQIVALYFDIGIRAIPGLNMNIFGRVESYNHDVEHDDPDLDLILGINIFPIRAFNIAPNIRYHSPATGDAGLTAFQLNFEFKY